MPKIYLANPYGFSEAGRCFLDMKLLPSLRSTGNHILNPWELSRDLAGELVELSKANSEQSEKRLREINLQIGLRNESAIRGADMVVAVLDGQEVDSGVCAELGFAYALRKRIYGYRSDFRLAGDNKAARVNIQLEAWIDRSGGRIFPSLESLARELQSLV